jgi:RNA polymerase sigma factor (sigma-70 family)
LAGVPAAIDELCVRLRCIARIVASRNKRANGLLRHHDLEDLVGEVVKTVWSHLGTYAGIGSLEAWTHSYCDHAFSNARRRRWRELQRERELAAEAEAPPLPEGGTDDTLQRCLQRLSETEQRVVARRMEDFTLAEIAAELGIKINTVKSHHARALKSLFQCCAGKAHP